MALDGTPQKSRLGGNATVATSLAVAHAAAAAAGQPLWRHLAGDAMVSLPLPQIQVFGGGAHAGRRIDVQDLMVMPVGAINDAGRKLMHLLRRLQTELKVNTTCGASNFSFGLPNRRGLNASFLPMMIGAGMTSAIMNPLHLEDIQAILGADVVMGHDPNCMSWIRKFREPQPETADAGGAGRRERRRARG